MTAKEQKIKEAYNALGMDLPKDCNKDGWSPVRYFKGHVQDHFCDEKKEGNVFLARPILLEDIEHNHGWKRIETEADLPPYNGGGQYICYTEKGNQVEMNGANAVRNAAKFGDVTHYRVKEELKKPIY
jgi:hypothetical protein